MTRRQAFWRGFRDCAPFLVIVLPFALLFGASARAAGLDVVQAMAMSVLVIAGAAQFTALALMQDQAPVLIILVTALAVNLRMAMYSAALVPHLGRAPLRWRMLIAYLMVDQAYASAQATYDAHPQMRLGAKLAYFVGCMSLMTPIWYAATLTGALLGQALPASLSLDFAVPICFTALLAPLLRSVPHVVTALVSCVGALAFAAVPWSLGLPLAAVLAMLAGAQTELWLQRREGR